MASLAFSSLNTGRFIFTCVLASPHHLPCQEHWDTSNLSDIDGLDEAVDNKLLLLPNLQFREGDGNLGGCLWSFLHLLWSCPLGGQCGTGGWLESASPGESFQGEFLGWLYLNGCWVNRFIHRCPSPVPLIQCLVMAWAIAHWPSWMVKGSAAR